MQNPAPMKNQFVIITYISVLLGMLALFSALTQEYQLNPLELNAQRIMAEGVRVQAIVIDKKEVTTPYSGTFSMPRKSVEKRVIIRVMDSPHKDRVLWQAAQEEAYNAITIGSTVHAYIKKDDLFIEELIVKKTRTRRHLITAFCLFGLAAIANIKANKQARQS